jgi:asparagine synthase (glutamine-hydrolysing)
MSGRTGNLQIVFNGEVYNYRELRRELSSYPFRSNTDTEVILAAYERWGRSCLDHFIGMFAFAIWDEDAQTLFCARDRIGIKPFLYARVDGRFVFASEARAILATGLRPEPDPQSWADYLAWGYTDHADRTAFKGITSLPPGHFLTVQPGAAPNVQRYWDLPGHALSQEPLPDEECAERLWELLRDSVRLRLRSDVPLGVNLSGGLDSATLMMAVDAELATSEEIHTFTATFGSPEYDELEFADEVSARSHWQRHYRQLKLEDFWDLAAHTVRHQEWVFGGVATIGYQYLNSLAAEMGVTVLLEGQGGDELFAGYEYFRPHFYADLLESGDCLRLRNELRAAPGPVGAALKHARAELNGRAEPVYQDGTSFLDGSAVAPEVHALSPEAINFEKPFPDRLRNALYRDLRFTKLPRVLRFNDRGSMAYSRELREPYLDHRIVEFAFSLKPEHRIRNGVTKVILRNAAKSRVPESMRTPGKRAVVTPQREWLRGPLNAMAEEIITSSSFASRGLFDPEAMRRSFARFTSGASDNAFFVWQWINTELWFREFIDRPVATTAPASGSPQ